MRRDEYMINVDFDWLSHLSACNFEINLKIFYMYIMVKMDMQPSAFYKRYI